MRRGESPRHPVYTHIYWPHVISREIDLREIAVSRIKRAPRVRGAAGANRSKTKQGKGHEIGELSSGKAGDAIKRKILFNFYRCFHSLTQRGDFFLGTNRL